MRIISIEVRTEIAAAQYGENMAREDLGLMRTEVWEIPTVRERKIKWTW